MFKTVGCNNLLMYEVRYFVFRYSSTSESSDRGKCTAWHLQSRKNTLGCKFYGVR